MVKQNRASNNRWATERYPDCRGDINESISFSGLTVDFFTKGKAAALISIIDQAMSNCRGRTCLDIGCGPGDIHSFLAGNVGKLVGVDVSGEAIEKASSSNPTVDYLSYDGKTLPFADSTFDAAYTICVIHHVPPPQWARFAAEAFRIIRPGGIFVVFEHNPWNPLTRLAVNRCAFDHDAVLLNVGTARRLLSNAGFAEVTSRFIFFTPFQGRLGEIIDRVFGRLPFGAQYYSWGRRPVP